MKERIRILDLFCGCGGLSLGFELYKGSISYETVLGLDIDPSAVRCFNANNAHNVLNIKTARICDLTWFNHEAEILLYYLLHYANWLPDNDLHKELFSKEINVGGFLSFIKCSDLAYNDKRKGIVTSPGFIKAFESIDSKVFSLAICKTFFSRLGIKFPIGEEALAPDALPWVEDYKYIEKPKNIEIDFENDAFAKSIENNLEEQWENEVKKLDASSGKQAWGQNAPVPERVKTLVSFLRGSAGKKIKTEWLVWRRNRDSARAFFSNSIFIKLSKLYTDSRRIHIILGGPPCKGFSRIGRPVITSLKDQGTYSWACDKFGDERNALLYRYVLALSALKPRIFVFENVENFKSPLEVGNNHKIDPPALLEEAIENLSDRAIRYDIRAKVLQASHFAVPQRRLRYIMIGFNAIDADEKIIEEFFNFPKHEEEVPLKAALDGLEAPKTFVFGSDNVKTQTKSTAFTLFDKNMGESYKTYIKWIRQPKPGEGRSPIYTDSHVVRGAREDDLGLIKFFAPGKRWMDYILKKSETIDELRQIISTLLKHVELIDEPDLPKKEEIEKLLKKINPSLALRLLIENISLPLLASENHLLSGGYLERGSGKHGDWFQRLDATRPSKTIVAHIGKDTYGYIHPFEDRAISIREAARIQSFPDFFEFGTEGIVEGYSLIGNAVPPLLAHNFATKLADFHENNAIFKINLYNRHKKKKSPSKILGTQASIRFSED